MIYMHFCQKKKDYFNYVIDSLDIKRLVNIIATLRFLWTMQNFLKCKKKLGNSNVYFTKKFLYGALCIDDNYNNIC